MAAVKVTRGSKWIGGNPKRPGKAFVVVGFRSDTERREHRRKEAMRGDTHALVRPADYTGRGAKERYTRLSRFVRGGANGYVPYQEESK